MSSPLAFPTPYADEFFGGVVLRYHQCFGAGDLRATLCKDLMVGRGAITGFPIGLDRLIGQVPGVWPNAMALLRNHTAWGLYSPFLGSASYQHALDEMQFGAASSLQLRLGDAASRVRFARALAACPQCQQEDLEQFGQDYFHVDHHLPGVIACHRHGMRLQFTPLTRTRTWNVKCVSRVATHEVEQAEVNLANLAVEFRRACLEPLEEGVLSRAYTDRLSSLGMITQHGSVRRSAVNRHIKGCHSDALLERLGVTEDGLHQWIYALLHRTTRSHHPIKHLLLVGAIFGSKDALLDACFQRELRPSDSRPAHLTTIEDRVEKYRSTKNVVVSTIARELDVSKTTCAVYLERLGCEPNRRPKILKVHLRKSIESKLRKGISVSVIAKRCHVSIATVGRVLRGSLNLQRSWYQAKTVAEAEKRRKAWLNLEILHPESQMTKLRTREPALYAWLYRNDRSWLNEHK